jgi:hypothetical protein
MGEGFTVQEYEAAALGDRLRGVLRLVEMLRGFDLGKVMELVEKVRAVQAADDLVDKVTIGIEVLELIADMTATDADDKIVAMIKSIATPDVIEIIVRIISGLTGNTMQDVTIAAADRQAMSAKGIPWSFLVQIALQLLPLIEGIIDDE